MPWDAVDFGSSTPLEGRCDAYESRASSWPLAATKTSLSRMSGTVRRNSSASRAARASSAVVEASEPTGVSRPGGQARGGRAQAHQLPPVSRARLRMVGPPLPSRFVCMGCPLPQFGMG